MIATVAKVMMVTTVWAVGYDVHATYNGFGSYDSDGWNKGDDSHEDPSPKTFVKIPVECIVCCEHLDGLVSKTVVFTQVCSNESGIP
jgi:hypothetical protein